MQRAIAHLSIGLALFLTSIANQGMAQSKPKQLKGTGWDALTESAPAVASDGVNRYAAWKGQSTNNIYFSVLDSKTGKWSEQAVVGGSGWTAGTNTGPALAYDGYEYVWLVWKGQGATDRVWYSTWNGSSWSAQQVVNGSGWNSETTVTPAITFAFGNTPYVAWLGASGNKIWYSYILDGWATQQTISGPETSIAPALSSNLTYELDLYTNGTNDISLTYGEMDSEPEPDWSSGGTLSCSAESNVTPAAAFFINTAKGPLWDDVVFWKNSSNNAISYSYNCGTVSGSSWSAETNVAPAVASSPNAAEASTAAILAWKNATDNTIWYLDPTTLPGMKGFH
ncbi:MAG: hypothetical protein WAU58_15125 [Terriglobales bacterium]